jgi:hypothetical protein
MKNIKRTLILLSIILMAGTLITCDFLDRPMTLILPSSLFTPTSTTAKEGGNSMVQIYDKASEDLVVILEIIPANEDDGNNNNDDTDQLTQLLDIPAFVTIPKESLSIDFTCLVKDSSVMGTATVKDVTVKATALHYKDAEDTVPIYNSDTKK